MAVLGIVGELDIPSSQEISPGTNSRVGTPENPRYEPPRALPPSPENDPEHTLRGSLQYALEGTL